MSIPSLLLLLALFLCSGEVIAIEENTTVFGDSILRRDTAEHPPVGAGGAASAKEGIHRRETEDSPKNELSLLCYNVENFFHPENDSLTQDDEFTPEGVRHWTYSRYNYKADMIAKVITNCCGTNHPAIVGLCEVENETCLRALRYRVRNLGYRYIHFDSPDARGIDVALLYDTTIAKVDTAYPIPVYLDPLTTTRDILYAQFYLKHETPETFIPSESPLAHNVADGKRGRGKGAFHLFLCHLPSQLGGTANTQWKRDKAISVLQHHIDSLFQISSDSQIIVMGDMNSAPMDNLTNMTNLSLRRQKNSHSMQNICQGTHKYNGIWTELDQFYVSPTLTDKTKCIIYDAPYLLERDEKYLGYKPKRTYVGMKYQQGYSDHLPVILRINY